MLRQLLTLALLAAPAAAAQAPVTLTPGVTYEQGIEFTSHGPVALHIVRAPKPGGLYVVRPLLSNDSILGRETLTAMQARTSAQVTAVSIDGDYTAATGEPSGILIRDGALDHPPVGGRSSAGIDTSGVLRVDRVSFTGTWRGTGQRRPLNGVNQPAKDGQVVLYTSAWGGTTPRVPGAIDAVLQPFPAATLDADLQSQVALLAGGGTPIPPGGAVLQARGAAIAPKLQTEAPEGTAVTIRLQLRPAWTGVTQAVGGGPLLVRAGKAIFRANEAFEPSGLLPRSARAAIGQLADGRLVLVTVDGDQPGYSVGMSNFELALALQRLGAQTAMALAPARAAALAFDGALLSRPPGPEQPVAEALSILYYGVYAPPLASPVQQLTYKLVRHANVRATLTDPDGAAQVLDEGTHDPGIYRFPFDGADGALPEGTWRWTIGSTDDLGAVSTAERTFTIDRTLGPLRVSPAVLRVGKKGGTLTVATTLRRSAALTLQIETPGGVVVAVATARAGAGPAAIAWNGLVAGAPARAGGYVAHVLAKSAVGISELQVPFTIRRAAAK